jgi:hypothetical protein
VRPVFVVVNDVVGQGVLQMASTEDQHPVEALATNSADEALIERIGPWSLGRLRMVRMCSDRKTSSKLEVNLASRSRIRNLTG